MSNIKEKVHLFINTSLLDLKSVKNIKNVIYEITKKFNDAIWNSQDTSEVNNRLFDNGNNKALFYTGLDKCLEEKCNNNTKKVQKIMENIPFFSTNNRYFTFKTKNVKIRLNNDGKYRLLSIVYIVNIESSDKQQKVFFLFPIEYIEVHK